MRSNYFLVFGILVFSSCQSKIDINKIRDEKTPMIIPFLTNKTVVNEVTLFKADTIQVFSDKWNKLKDFGHNNIYGWKHSIVSYNSDYYLSQGNFRLLGWIGSNGVVIAFDDSNGKPVQYTKRIRDGELDFLIK